MKADIPYFVNIERQLPLNEKLRKFSSMKILDSKSMEISNMISRLMTYLGCKYIRSTFTQWLVNIWSTISQHLVSKYISVVQIGWKINLRIFRSNSEVLNVLSGSECISNRNHHQLELCKQFLVFRKFVSDKKHAKTTVCKMDTEPRHRSACKRVHNLDTCFCRPYPCWELSYVPWRVSAT